MSAGVHVEEWPGPRQRPLVVCIHALGGSSAHWVGVAPMLAELGATQALDLGGHGQTPAAVGATLQENREMLARHLARVGPAVLVGSSFGGGVALMQAAADPASVRGIVLSGSMLPNLADYSHGVRRVLLQRRLRQRGSDAATAFRAVREGRLRRGGITEYLLRGNAAAPEAMDPAIVRHIIDGRRPAFATAARTTLVGGMSSFRLMTNPRQFAEIVNAISAPVLVIHGDRDRTVPVELAIEIGHSRPDWRVTVLPGVGHLPHIEAPDRWFAAVAAWWPTVDSGGS